MSKQEFQYYFGSVFLYGVLSILEHTFDSPHSTNVVEKCQKVLLRSEALAGWLLDELFSLNESQAALDVESAEPILLNWVERVQQAAACESESTDAQIHLYYLGVNWGLQVLLEFDRLVNSLSEDKLQLRYRANLRLFEQLTTWLKSEMKSMAEREKVDLLRTQIDTVAEQLVTEWSDRIERLSEGHFRGKTTLMVSDWLQPLDGVAHHFAQVAG